MRFFDPFGKQKKVGEIMNTAEAKAWLSINTGRYDDAARIFKESYETARKFDNGAKSSVLLAKAAEMILNKALIQLGKNDKKAAASFFEIVDLLARTRRKKGLFDDLTSPFRGSSVEWKGKGLQGHGRRCIYDANFAMTLGRLIERSDDLESIIEALNKDDPDKIYTLSALMRTNVKKTDNSSISSGFEALRMHTDPIIEGIRHKMDRYEGMGYDKFLAYIKTCEDYEELAGKKDENIKYIKGHIYAALGESADNFYSSHYDTAHIMKGKGIEKVEDEKKKILDAGTSYWKRAAEIMESIMNEFQNNPSTPASSISAFMYGRYAVYSYFRQGNFSKGTELKEMLNKRCSD